MSTQQSNPGQYNDTDCKDCKDIDNLTQKTITAERQKLCTILYDTSGTVTKMEKRFHGEKEIYHEKKRLFTWTETNYKLYRNLEITVGVELLQTNESVKANVTAIGDLNTKLHAQLKNNIAKGIKDLRAKINDLKDASCKLSSSLTEKCNVAQWKALTGNGPENCKEGNRESIPACKDAEEIFKELVNKPLGLLSDYDSLFQSSYDVVGIQLFSNLDTLAPLQKDLETFSKSFEAQVNSTMKLREQDLKNCQNDLVKSVTDLTKAAMDRNSTRSDFEGYKDAVTFLCCPVCGCVQEPDGHQHKDGDCGCKHDGRLKQCEKDICWICDDVKKTFCCTKPEPPNTNDNKSC